MVSGPGEDDAGSFLYREDYLLFGMLVRHGLIDPAAHSELVRVQRKGEEPKSLLNLLSAASELDDDQQKRIQELLDILADKKLAEKLPAHLPEVETIVATLAPTIADSDPDKTKILTVKEGTEAPPTVTDQVSLGNSQPTIADTLDSLASTGSLTAEEISRIESALPKGGMIGAQVSGHIVLDKLGSGGQGDVYLAKQLSLNRYVAMKKLEVPGRGNAGAFVQAFRREAETLASINHSRIVKIYDIFQQADSVFFTMEYISGKTMKDLTTDTGGLPSDVAANLACQALSALSRTSADGLIHRDIKPANMLIDENGDLKIVDFGLAAAQEATAAGDAFAGTPHFASPEQCASKALTSASDQYSLGVTMFYALTGEFPFKAKKLTDMLDMHVRQPPPAPSSINPDLSRLTDRVLLRMMAKNPEDRYPSFDECFEAWQKILMESKTGDASLGAQQLLGEELLRLSREDKDRLQKQSIVLAALWFAMTAGVFVNETRLIRWGLDWLPDAAGDYGTLLLAFSLSCIFYVAAARRGWLPVLGSLRGWLYTHIVTAIPAVFMLMIHSGNFLHGIMPGGAPAKPILSILMGTALVITAVSGSIGLLIFRELRRSLQLNRMKLRGSSDNPKAMEMMAFSAQLLSGWRLVHYPLAIFFLLISILHIVVSISYWAPGG